ncbi:MAG TPA: transposase [Burkholderiales bacterium]
MVRGLVALAERAVEQVGCDHPPVLMSRPGQRRQRLSWVDTVLGNVKNALHGSFHAIRPRHLARYLAEFAYRFNRRFDLAGMLERLATPAAHTRPMP